jgi:hypothetical protein
MRKALSELQTQLEQERILHQEEKAVLASKIEVLTAQLAAERYKSGGEQERVEHNAQVRELKGGLPQSGRWVIEEIHDQENGVPATKQKLRTTEMVHTGSRSSIESVAPVVQLLEEASPRRTKRRRLA